MLLLAAHGSPTDPRPAAVARELTKKFEQVRRAPLGELARQYAAEDAPKGEVVLLVGLEGLTYAEAAEVLDVPLGTVMSRLNRGRQRLRELMDTKTTPAIRRIK